MLNSSSMIGLCLLLGARAPLGGTASGGPDPAQFTLLDAVPADCVVVVGGRGNPERDFIAGHWSRVWNAAEENGVADAAWGLFASMEMGDGQEQVQKVVRGLGEKARAVDWCGWLGREWLLAARLASRSGGPPMECVLLGRQKAEAAADNFSKMKSFLEAVRATVVEQAPDADLRIEEREVSGAMTVTLRPGDAPPGMGLTVWMRRDVIGVGFGPALQRAVIGRLSGESKEATLASAPRFSGAFANLPAAEDAFVFLDIKKLNAALRGLAGAVSSGGPEEISGVAAGARRLLGDLDFLETWTQVQWTEGRAVHSEEWVAIGPESGDSPLFKVADTGRTLEDFGRWAPKEATSLSSFTGLDVPQAVRYLVGYFNGGGEEGGEGDDDHAAAGVWAQLKHSFKDEWKADLEKDVLGSLVGEFAWVEADEAFLLAVRINNEAAVRKVIERIGRRLKRLAGSGTVVVESKKIAGQEGFTSVSIPMMAVMQPGLTPTFGCAEGHLLIGSSPAMVNKCLKTAQGKHPRLADTGRFRDEGLAPGKGGCQSICYKDHRDWGRNAAKGLGAGAMALGFAGMAGGGGGGPDQAFLQRLPPLLTALAAVASEVDFYRGFGQVTCYEKDGWRTKTVQHYAAPQSNSAEQDEE